MNQPIEKYIDHTLLDPAVSRAQITKLCSEAREHGFFAVCVNSCHVRQAHEELKGSGVIVASTIGFPLGASLTSTKVAEAEAAIADGVQEIDMVINIGALKDGDMDVVINDIQAVVKATKDLSVSQPGRRAVPVKVIIECDLLTDEEKVTAAKACVQAGAAMVKTCTGFVKNGKGGTVEDVRIIKDAIAGTGLGIKASGGIRDYAAAKALIEAGATRIGTSSGIAIVATAHSAV